MADEYTRYLSPFSTRYASEEMQFLFSAQHKFALWRRLWIILAEAEQALGLPITDAQIAEMKAHAEDIDFDAAAAYEKQLRHDVMAHIHAWGDQCPLARPIIHLGATSCYVGDNADILILRDALHLIQGRLVAVIRALRDFAEAYADLPCLGYTHFQSAQPTTVGKRAALWLNDLTLDLEEINFCLDTLKPLGCKGTTGTQASFLELFQGDYEKVQRLDRLIAEKMGFAAAVPVSGQTYSRKMDARVLSALSQIGQSALKFANDIRLLAHEKEIEEPFEARQIGSSAMAYKRNPMRSERMTGLSRFLMTNAQNAALTASEQWLERTLDDSANRRLSLAEGFLCCDAVLALYLNIASGLVVYDRMIEKHLREELPFMATENILMDAVARGGDRQALHERIRVHSMEAARAVKMEGKQSDLLARIAADPAFHVDENALENALAPANYIGCAAMQTREYLRQVIDPLLARYAGNSVAVKDITV
ncbi:MAG: adenylosuccinate lyase [Clostridiales bacterium]|nr:adenylosuccinate lyase [Clostridiales bacterium]